MTELKELPEGLALNEEYALEHWICEDSSGIFFAASSAAGEPLLAKLVPDSNRDGAQLEIWERSRQLRHRHLLLLRDAGSIELEGSPYVYAIFERPEEVLATALKEGPLGDEETRGVLDAALSALRYLHGQGLVHGAVDPMHVVAVGDLVKLSTDGLRNADGMRARAEDVRQLGELVRTLRGSEPLGEPMETVVRQAAEPDPAMRWTLAEIAVAMEPAPVRAPLPVQVQEPEPEPEPTPQLSAPVREELLPPPVRPSRQASPPIRFPRWIFAGVGLLLLAILAINLRRKPAAPAPVVVSTPAPQIERVPIQPASVRPPSRRPAWRVIAYTYGSHDLAAKKATYVNGHWPQMHATVLAANDKRGLFLVSLGGALGKDEAIRLQRKARSIGLPKDTYIQNFNE